MLQTFFQNTVVRIIVFIWAVATFITQLADLDAVLQSTPDERGMFMTFVWWVAGALTSPYAVGFVGALVLMIVLNFAPIRERIVRAAGNNQPVGANGTELVRLRDALIYMAYDAFADTEIRHNNPEKIAPQYTPLIGASERIFELASDGEIEVYGRQIIFPDRTTRTVKEMQKIPKEVCAHIGLTINHFLNYANSYGKEDDPETVCEAEATEEYYMHIGFSKCSGDSDKENIVGYWTDIRIDMEEVKRYWKSKLNPVPNAMKPEHR